MVTIELTGPASGVVKAAGESVTFQPAPSTNVQDYFTDVEVLFSRAFTYPTKRMCKTKIDFGIDFGSDMNKSAFADGVIGSPCPISPASKDHILPDMSFSGAVPSTNMEETWRVAGSVMLPEAATIVVVVSFNMFDTMVSVYDVTDGGTIQIEDRPAFVSNPFRVSADISGTGVVHAPKSDPVLIATDKFSDSNISVKPFSATNVSFIDTSYGDMIRARGPMKQKILKARENIVKMMLDGTDFGLDMDSIIFGINPEANALAILEVPKTAELKAHVVKVVTGNISGILVKGDILYPANPHLAVNRAVFDIISDSEYWTRIGPTVGEYEDGQGSTPPPETIFSWEGRSSSAPITLTRTLAGLPEDN